MIDRIPSNEMHELVERNAPDMALGPQSRGQGSWVFLRMVSEDGTNFLQGFAGAETFKTQRGWCFRVCAIWVDPACRGIGFGKVLLDHVERAAQGEFEGEAAVASIAKLPTDSSAASALFSSAGYELTKKATQITASREW